MLAYTLIVVVTLATGDVMAVDDIHNPRGYRTVEHCEARRIDAIAYALVTWLDAIVDIDARCVVAGEVA